MKRIDPQLQNRRVIDLAARALLLPFTLVRAAHRAAVTLLERRKSPQRRRAEDQLRQSRVRRNLRGLAQDHVQEPAKPA